MVKSSTRESEASLEGALVQTSEPSHSGSASTGGYRGGINGKDSENYIKSLRITFREQAARFLEDVSLDVGTVISQDVDTLDEETKLQLVAMQQNISKQVVHMKKIIHRERTSVKVATSKNLKKQKATEIKFTRRELETLQEIANKEDSANPVVSNFLKHHHESETRTKYESFMKEAERRFKTNQKRSGIGARKLSLVRPLVDNKNHGRLLSKRESRQRFIGSSTIAQTARSNADSEATSDERLAIEPAPENDIERADRPTIVYENMADRMVHNEEEEEEDDDDDDDDDEFAQSRRQLRRESRSAEEGTAGRLEGEADTDDAPLGSYFRQQSMFSRTSVDKQENRQEQYDKEVGQILSELVETVEELLEYDCKPFTTSVDPIDLLGAATAVSARQMLQRFDDYEEGNEIDRDCDDEGLNCSDDENASQDGNDNDEFIENHGDIDMDNMFGEHMDYMSEQGVVHDMDNAPETPADAIDIEKRAVHESKREQTATQEVAIDNHRKSHRLSSKSKLPEVSLNKNAETRRSGKLPFLAPIERRSKKKFQNNDISGAVDSGAHNATKSFHNRRRLIDRSWRKVQETHVATTSNEPDPSNSESQQDGSIPSNRSRSPWRRPDRNPDWDASSQPQVVSKKADRKPVARPNAKKAFKF